jgi:hypothetical protein
MTSRLVSLASNDLLGVFLIVNLNPAQMMLPLQAM